MTVCQAFLKNCDESEGLAKPDDGDEEGWFAEGLEDDGWEDGSPEEPSGLACEEPDDEEPAWPEGDGSVRGRSWAIFFHTAGASAVHCTRFGSGSSRPNSYFIIKYTEHYSI